MNELKTEKIYCLFEMFLNGILWEGKSLEMHKIPDAIWSALRWKASFHFLQHSNERSALTFESRPRGVDSCSHFWINTWIQRSSYRYSLKINHFHASLTSPFVTSQRDSLQPFTETKIIRFDWNGVKTDSTSDDKTVCFWWKFSLMAREIVDTFELLSWKLKLNYYTIFNRTSPTS